MSVPINATCKFPPMPTSAHAINDTYQCPSELPFSAAYQCQ
ncbi:unnamed protein product, partial [Staurois parvus]